MLTQRRRRTLDVPKTVKQNRILFALISERGKNDAVRTWKPETPDQGLPTLPPAKTLTPNATLLVEAAQAAARLDEAARATPNPHLLVSVLPFLEAQASSAIENIVTSNDAMFRQQAIGGDDAATDAALRLRSALTDGYALIQQRPASASTAHLICSTLLGHEVGVRDGDGTFIGNAATHERIYTPPVGRRRIEGLLENWAMFVHSHALDPISTMAVAHYQFEAIHPFHDGNGRTGRVLNLLHLIESGIISSPILHLSGYVNEHRSDYYRLLQAVTAHEEWDPWIEFMTKGVRDSARSTLLRVQRVSAAMHDVASIVDERMPTGVHTQFVTLLFEGPYTRISDVLERCQTSRPTARKWLNALVDAGVLSTVTIGRDKLFVNERLTGALFLDAT